MSEKMSKTLRTNDAEWRRVMAINLDSVFQLVNGIAPAMADAPRSAEEGAATEVWLATRAFDVVGVTDAEKITGVLWEDNQIVPW